MTDITALYDEHMDNVYGFFVVKTGHRGTAEDLTSRVFTTLLEQLENKGADIQDPVKYLYGVMKITWTQHLRKKYSEPVDYVEDIEDFQAYTTDEVRQFRSQPLAEKAAPYIQKAPKKQREVLQMRFIDGLTLREICDELQKDMNYVKTTQKRSIATLKKLVNEELEKGARL